VDYAPRPTQVENWLLVRARGARAGALSNRPARTHTPRTPARTPTCRSELRGGLNGAEIRTCAQRD